MSRLAALQHAMSPDIAVNLATAGRMLETAANAGANAYGGHSVIAGPDGSLLAQAGDGETVLTAAYDLARRAEIARNANWLGELKPWLKPNLRDSNPS